MRQAWRAVRSAPGYSALLILILALGIGADTAVFSVAHEALAGALPYPDADRLVRIWERRPEQGRERNAASLPDYVDWREQSSSFEAMTTFRGSTLNFSTEGPPRRIRGAEVTRGFFEVFGVTPSLSRTFSDDEWDQLGAPVLILSDRLWQSTFGGDAEIIGTSVSVDLVRYTVVGVMPPAFDFPYDAEYWFPRTDDPASAGRGSHGFQVVAKLAPDVTIEGARADLDGIAHRLEEEYPDTNRGHYTAVYDLRSEILGDTGPALLLLSGAVGVILLIVCVNIGNMMLVRSAGRAHALAIRASMGASRGRLIRQQLTESLLLAGIAGAVSILVADGTYRLLGRLGASRVPWAPAPHLDLGILPLVLGLATATGALFGLAPALTASRVDVAGNLRDNSRTAGLGRNTRRWQGALVVTQISMALVLLAGAGLLTRNLAALLGTDIGFETDRRLVADLSLPPARYSEPDAVRQFHAALEQRLAAIPGVTHVALAWYLPMSGWQVGRDILLEGRTPPQNSDEWSTRLRAVSRGYFTTMGMRLLEGRSFEPSDGPDAPTVGVIDETLRRRYWPDRSPLGDRLAFDTEGPWITIIGVVNDVRHQGPQHPPDPELYLTLAQEPIPEVSLVVQTRDGVTVTADQLRAAVTDIDSDQPLANIRTLDDAVADWLGERREVASLLDAFALVALVLATLGNYGVVSYAVTQRTSEFGLRMALGGQPGDVLRGAMAGGARLVVLGVTLGAAVYVPAARWIRPLLDDVSIGDPLALGTAVGALALVALLAVLVPALRATRVDPADSLRAT